MSLKTSNLPFKARVDHEVHNTIMRKAVVKAQETIGANRQKMVVGLPTAYAKRCSIDMMSRPVP